MEGIQVSLIKFAEWRSTQAADFLVAGLALFWQEKLGPFDVPILASNRVAHAIGRRLKHQCGRSTTPLPCWVTALMLAMLSLLA